MVDPRRLELLTSSMPWKRSSQLNYGPVKRVEIYPKPNRNQADLRLLPLLRENAPPLLHVFFDAFEHDFVDQSAFLRHFQTCRLVEHQAFGGLDRPNRRRPLASGDEGVLSKQAPLPKHRESVASDRNLHRAVHDDVGFVIAFVIFFQNRRSCGKVPNPASG